ncbi:murein hydrolase activator EnvC family protein [Pseudomonas sp. N040]|uniref:murein hydrolase activator EnvC family protein n=1 Tax=Pseudomonas sp. N040 TaxID=2785325 RepID=UPI0018A250AC|nr:murein hydrolase activator EnvC [Pseudomonas sp. N040]MBF7728543.1 murein hydrolase activator EnvC [Pseudomonas sp. N040]MBW7012183.1 murein hydrolase activator EnvC [Pseudomonas sp. N040]
MFRALFLVMLAALLNPALADERADAQRQLEQASKDIAELQQLMQQLQKEKSSVQQALQKTETEMGTLEKQVRDLQQELKDSESELKRLDDEQKKLQSARQEQQKLIAIQVRAAYQGGDQEPLRLLLNQQQPEKFSRTLTYYEYLGKARLEQLATFNETLRQLANVEQAIVIQQTRLQQQKATLEEQRAQLAGLRQERRNALAKLNKEYSARDRRLKERQQEQEALAAVLKSIEATLARQAREAEEARQQALLAQQASPATEAGGPLVSAAGSAYAGPMSKARGQLPWPVNGRLVARYGSARGGDSRSTWDGVMISAAAGSPVKAVYGGRVVFADWLRGAGLLVIVDHGDGYLTLYGHNQSLLKNAGDLVKAGEAISTVGNSGGQETPALYFAIRQQGRPTNPAQWCRAQG